jgi:hypothetical protein
MKLEEDSDSARYSFEILIYEIALIRLLVGFYKMSVSTSVMGGLYPSFTI